MAQLQGNTVTLTSPSPACATSDEPPDHAQPVDSHLSVPPLVEHGGAILAAVWFPDHHQSCCLLAENKTHFWTMGNCPVGLCSLWSSREGEGLNPGMQGWGRAQPLLVCCEEWQRKASPFPRPTGKAPGGSQVLILGSLLCPLGGQGHQLSLEGGLGARARTMEGRDNRPPEGQGDATETA